MVHPWRVLRRATAMCALVGCTAVPVVTSTSEYVPAPRRDPRVVAIERAYGDIDAYLAPRTPTLDAERRARLSRVIVDESIEKGFDPLFVLAVIEAESGYDHEAVSPTGAKGLMQIIPQTWDLVAQRYGLGRLEKFNPVNSARIGICYLHLLTRGGFRDPWSLLLAYNQGPGMAVDVSKGYAEPTEEAKAYGPTVIGVYRRILRDFRIPSKDVKKLFRNPFGTLVRVS